MFLILNVSKNTFNELKITLKVIRLATASRLSARAILKSSSLL